MIINSYLSWGETMYLWITNGTQIVDECWISLWNMFEVLKTNIILLLCPLSMINCINVLKISNVDNFNNSAVEIENSKINPDDDFSLCVRFSNPYLATTLDIWQNLVYITSTDMWLLGKVVIIDCDSRYDGCNAYYKSKLGLCIEKKIQNQIDGG